MGIYFRNYLLWAFFFSLFYFYNNLKLYWNKIIDKNEGNYSQDEKPNITNEKEENNNNDNKDIINDNSINNIENNDKINNIENNKEEIKEINNKEVINDDNNNKEVITDDNNNDINNNDTNYNEIINENNVDKKMEININITRDEKVKEKDKLILQLKKTLDEKDLQIKSIMKANNKLKQALENISKQIDGNLFDEKGTKKFFENLKGR